MSSARRTSAEVDASRRLVTLRDLKLGGTIPFLLTCAWVMPERRVLRLARSFAHRRRTRPAGTLLMERLLYLYRDIRPGGWQPELALEGTEHLDDGLAGGRGVVLWVADTVCMTMLLKKALADAGYALHHLSQAEHGVSSSRLGTRVLNPLHNHIENRYLKERIVVDRGSEVAASRRLREILVAGGLVSIVGWGHVAKRVVMVPSRGGRLPIATGAPALAHATGAALLPVFSIRDTAANDRFRCVVEAPIAVRDDLPRRQAIEHMASEFVARHERWFDAFPEQFRGVRVLAETGEIVVGE